MTTTEIQSLISQLSESVQSFHDRFGITGKTTREELLSRIPIQTEEISELNYSILNESEERIANEAVDVLYVAIGTVLRLDSRISKLALKEVIDKNNGKTLVTHYINEAGKVSRRSYTV